MYSIKAVVDSVLILKATAGRFYLFIFLSCFLACGYQPTIPRLRKLPNPLVLKYIYEVPKSPRIRLRLWKLFKSLSSWIQVEGNLTCSFVLTTFKSGLDDLLCFGRCGRGLQHPGYVPVSASVPPEGCLEVHHGRGVWLGLLGGQEAPVPLEGGQARMWVSEASARTPVFSGLKLSRPQGTSKPNLEELLLRL